MQLWVTGPKSSKLQLNQLTETSGTDSSLFRPPCAKTASVLQGLSLKKGLAAQKFSWSTVSGIATNFKLYEMLGSDTKSDSTVQVTKSQTSTNFEGYIEDERRV